MKKISHLFLAASVALSSLNVAAQKRDTFRGMDAEERGSANEKIFDAARKNYLEILSGSKSAYSLQLDSLEQTLNAYLQRNDASFVNKTVVMDPILFDIGLALGIRGDTLVRAIVGKDTGIDSNMVMDILSWRDRPSVHGNVLFNKDRLPATHFLIPHVAHGDETPSIRGMTPQQTVDFTNAHEAWHVKDTRYTYIGLDSAQVMNWIGGYNTLLLDYPDRLKAAVVKHQRETLADIGALGDMIRKGESPDIIDVVADWRMGNKDDTEHMSVDVLKAFKDYIEETGVDHFRKLREKDVYAAYIRLVDDHSMNENRMILWIKYKSAKPEAKLDMLKASKTDPKMAKAIGFEKLFSTATADAVYYDGSAPDAAEREEIEKLEKNWKPLQELKKKAFALEQKITPESVIRAYVLTADDLQEKIKTDPYGAYLHKAKINLLQKSFTEGLMEIDYAAANAKFKVRPSHIGLKRDPQ